MDADPTFLPPGSYALTWPLLGALLLLAFVVWATVVWLSGRPPEELRRAPMPPGALAKARAEALARIDAVEASVHAGETSARQGHHELSRTVRRFVADVAGLDAERMTAADLRARGPERLAGLVETYYPSQFGVRESEPPTITSAAQAGREVVGGWS